MPTYEYVCRSCGHIFEIVQSMREDALTECPECGGELRKVFAPPAIAFKGSGFYATDQRRKTTRAGDGEGRDDKGEKTDKGERTDKGDGKAGSGGGDAKKDSKEDAPGSSGSSKKAASSSSKERSGS